MGQECGGTFEQVAVEVQRAQVELYEDQAHFLSPEWQHFAVSCFVLTLHKTMVN